MGTSGRPESLSDGDTVEIEVDGVGRLEHYVEAT
jgi:2-keto-4-pentenoate hydratase/2-oxohepta-3-ene-1,7-dioic acid hydratase in catechol pathway